MNTHSRWLSKVNDVRFSCLASVIAVLGNAVSDTPATVLNVLLGAHST